LQLAAAADRRETAEHPNAFPRTNTIRGLRSAWWRRTHRRRALDPPGDVILGLASSARIPTRLFAIRKISSAPSAAGLLL